MEPSLIYDKLKEMGYLEENMIMLVNRLTNLTPEVMPSFQAWLSGEDNIDLSVESISYQELLNQHKLNPIASFLTLDWLVREPDKAQFVIRRGYDLVEVEDAN